MTTQITEQAEQTPETATEYVPTRWERIRLADQRQAIAALDRITELHPDLPAMRISLDYISPRSVDVQAQSWPALEAWREALNVAPSEVRPGNCAPEREHLQFETEVDGVPVRVWAMGDLVEADEAPAVSA
ncbi:hypothetical protein QBA57_28800 [Streptomyces scabiei]|uniref:hypothetical protein n=1 Tax=Streptomyces scabiei TaxID=1930 RepID=UPI001B32DAD8|nr:MULTISPECIES: hypothetical protein [Streptomyces]MBP5883134.1 hypothetical protein [Streptomyces sp. LBUM 1487]MDX2628626.1 hypothetical protein [Streptomyces scabiei]MDX3162708.1 hypothetical protein [Streptomyces scabiei]